MKRYTIALISLESGGSTTFQVFGDKMKYEKFKDSIFCITLYDRIFNVKEIMISLIDIKSVNFERHSYSLGISDCILILYDITKSDDNILIEFEKIYKIINKYMPRWVLPIIICGNKCDKNEGKKVKKEMNTKIQKKYENIFLPNFSISALKNINIGLLYEYIININCKLRHNITFSELIKKEVILKTLTNDFIEAYNDKDQIFKNKIKHELFKYREKKKINNEVCIICMDDSKLICHKTFACLECFKKLDKCSLCNK
jgi:GTPase SAR1 family protein